MGRMNWTCSRLVSLGRTRMLCKIRYFNHVMIPFLFDVRRTQEEDVLRARRSTRDQTSFRITVRFRLTLAHTQPPLWMMVDF